MTRDTAVNGSNSGRRMGLAGWIFVGLIAGVICGLFFGEYCARIDFIGKAFIGLMQMTILPYIAVALVTNIGRLDLHDARMYARVGGVFFLISCVAGLAAIVLMPQSFPAIETASFFSVGMTSIPEEVDFLDLFIPSNPFFSFANNVVPAVVVFCVCFGLALMGLKNKQIVLDQLDLVSQSLSRINMYIVKFTPLGVFAIVAAAAGTMAIDDLGRLEAYAVAYTVIAFALTFGILPLLVSTLTPFSYWDVIRASRGALLTAFATGKVFIVLPMLIAGAEELLERKARDTEKPRTVVRSVIPLIYPFPSAGKLISLLFVPFAAWFVGSTMAAQDYATLLSAGFVSYFGSPLAAMPFLLDLQKLPADMFELFVVSGVYTSRLSDLAGAMHLLVVGLLTACGLSGLIKLDARRVMGFVAVAAAIGAVAIGGSRIYLQSTLDVDYQKDKVVANMHLLLSEDNSVVHREVPEKSPGERTDYRGLKRVRETGVLRVGYHPDNLPFSFFNAKGDLVGFDIDMAHLLARELECRLEFVPFDFQTMAEQLEANDFDIIMSGVGVLTRRLEYMRFTDPYLYGTLGLVVPDHMVGEYSRRLAGRDFAGARLAVARSPYVRDRLAEMLPGAEVVEFKELRDFFEQDHDVEALVHGAEAGSAWTLLYPGFSVVVPPDGGRKIPVAYPVGRGDGEFEDFMNHWIELKRGSGDIDRIYNHWILGKGSERVGPRWSIIRDVLGWVE